MKEGGGGLLQAYAWPGAHGAYRLNDLCIRVVLAFDPMKCCCCPSYTKSTTMSRSMTFVHPQDVTSPPRLVVSPNIHTIKVKVPSRWDKRGSRVIPSTKPPWNSTTSRGRRNLLRIIWHQYQFQRPRFSLVKSERTTNLLGDMYLYQGWPIEKYYVALQQFPLTRTKGGRNRRTQTRPLIHPRESLRHNTESWRYFV